MTQPTAPDVAELSTQLAALVTRIETLEAELSEVLRAQQGGVPDEVLLAISAAVAGYLGKRARVRQVHLRRGPGWSSQGRASIQESHHPTRPARPARPVREKN